MMITESMKKMNFSEKLAADDAHISAALKLIEVAEYRVSIDGI